MSLKKERWNSNLLQKRERETCPLQPKIMIRVCSSSIGDLRGKKKCKVRFVKQGGWDKNGKQGEIAYYKRTLESFSAHKSQMMVNACVKLFWWSKNVLQKTWSHPKHYHRLFQSTLVTCLSFFFCSLSLSNQAFALLWRGMNRGGNNEKGGYTEKVCWHFKKKRNHVFLFFIFIMMMSPYSTTPRSSPLLSLSSSPDQLSFEQTR